MLAARAEQKNDDREKMEALYAKSPFSIRNSATSLAEQRVLGNPIRNIGFSMLRIEIPKSLVQQRMLRCCGLEGGGLEKEENNG